MSTSPDHTTQFSAFEATPEEQTEQQALTNPGQYEAPRRIPSRASPSTKYEFITTTGGETAAAAKRKLKTVRSHVMRNYLHQQQQGRGSVESLLTAEKHERRRGKQRSRSSRSVSRDTENQPTNPGVFAQGQPLGNEISVLLSGFSLVDPNSYFGSLDPSLKSAKESFGLDFSYDSQEDVSLFARFHLTSLLHDKSAGIPEPGFDTLNCRGETVRLIKETLEICGEAVPEPVVFAICLLAFGCAVECDWAEARGHVEALQRLVDGRGGLETTELELQRVLVWTMYCLTAMLLMPPHFEPPLFAHLAPPPLAFVDEAQMRAWRTVRRFPKNTPLVFDILIPLHQLALATSPEWHDEVDQRVTSNLYFDVLRRVNAFQHDEPWKDSLPPSALKPESATMFKVWAMGLPIFVWATARHLRTRTGLIVTPCEYDLVYSRVRTALDADGGCHSWPRGKSLEPVLATLFYCLESCTPNNPSRAWFIGSLKNAVGMLKLKDVDNFRKTLAFFPITDEYKVAAGDIWREHLAA